MWRECLLTLASAWLCGSAYAVGCERRSARYFHSPEMGRAQIRSSIGFAEFQRSLGIASNVLATRLDAFVAAGIMERRTYSRHEDHHEYLLTDKGRDLAPVVIALTAWGDRWAAPNGPPFLYRHRTCGGEIAHSLACSSCGELAGAEEIEGEFGPGSQAKAAQPLGNAPAVPTGRASPRRSRST